MAGYALSYAALVARDVDAVCQFLGNSLRLARTDINIQDEIVPFFGVGDASVAVFQVKSPYLDGAVFPGLHHIALTSRDPLAAVKRHKLPIINNGIGPCGRKFVVIDDAATCGIRTRFIEPISVSVVQTKIERINHLGVASFDILENIRVFSDELGCPLESTETDIEIRNVTESFVSDKYGAIYHNRPPEILGGLRAAFITVGDCDLEIMTDFDAKMEPSEDLGRVAGNTKGDQSAIARFLARRGQGLVHIAFETFDIDTILADLEKTGWRIIDKAGRPGGRCSKIGFVHPSNFGGGLLIHFVKSQNVITGN